MKKIATVLALAGLLTLTTGSAFGFSLGGYVGPIQMDIIGFSESGDTSHTAGALGTGETWAIFNLNKIINPLDPLNPLWEMGDGDNERIYGFIWGLTDSAISGPPTSSLIEQVGGEFSMHLYNDTNDGSTADEFLFNDPNGANAIDAPQERRTAPSTYESVTDGGSLFLTGDFVPGIDPITASTVEQLFNFTSGSGTGEGFADLDGGAFFPMFDTSGEANNQGGYNDFRFSFTVNTDNAPPGGWFAGVNDPVDGNVIPEPVSMVTFGMGLLGFLGLKKKKVA